MPGELPRQTLGDILGNTFTLYGRGFLKLAAIVAVTQSIVYLVGFLLLGSVLVPALVSPVGPGIFFLLGILMVVLIIGAVLVQLFAEGALIHTVAVIKLGRDTDFATAMRVGWKKLGQMLGAALLIFLALLGMSITVVGIPFAIYFGVRWALALHAVVVENAGSREALSRSSRLVEGSWWRVLGILLVMAIIVGAITSAASWVLGFIPIIGELIVTVLATPLAIIPPTLLYYDLRAREAPVTIHQAATELGASAPGEPPAPIR